MTNIYFEYATDEKPVIQSQRPYWNLLHQRGNAGWELIGVAQVKLKGDMYTRYYWRKLVVLRHTAIMNAVRREGGFEEVSF